MRKVPFFCILASPVDPERQGMNPAVNRKD
ncbi:hypothetical protein [Akkermansia phage Moulinsart]|nr:hypothetical protein [Akkermansia phage Moulinsart]